MATILDFGLLQGFSFIFPVLLVFSFVFAVLQKTEVIGKTMGINALVAIVAAFMVLLSDTITQMINFMVPWFTVTIIFLILLILVFQLFGGKDMDLKKAIEDTTLRWTLIGIGLLIIIAAFGQVLGQKLTESSFQVNETIVTDGSSAGTASFSQNITATLFNPKVLGLMIVFAIAIFTVALMSG